MKKDDDRFIDVQIIIHSGVLLYGNRLIFHNQECKQSKLRDASNS